MNESFANQILRIFANSPFDAFNPKQVAAKVGARDKSGRQAVHDAILELAEQKYLVEEGRGRYKVNPKNINDEFMPKNSLVGTIDMKQTGKAYVIPADPERGEDILIAPNNTHHALHGDTVRIELFPQRKMHKPEGQVVEILQRAKTRFVGRIQKMERFAFLICDNRNMPVDIFIPLTDLDGAEDGEKAVVEMLEWPDRMNNPVGRVVNRLGRPGDNNVEMQSILAEFDFPLSFPKEAEEEAARIAEPEERDLRSRKDFRKVTTFTIDPADAKDFDDALSFRPLENGNFEVGVHIADVSFYVQPGSAIDQEAYLRGTSVYLVDRTIPMLPEKLCNGVCSLRPHEDKLCFSVVFEITPQADILNPWFGKTVINSDTRYAYEEAQSLIDGSAEPVSDTDRAILELNRLASMLRAGRFKEGAINFESQEVKFDLDPEGRPLGVHIVESKEANWLIEEFMLVANRLVAAHIGATPKGSRRANPKTFVYRVHDEPNPEKLNTFVEFVSKLGFKMKVSSRKALAQSYNQLFERISGRGEENMIDSIAIRTMSKAYYSTQNIGHYGLAFPFYTHFTSPIRRYPDLMVHRLLERYLHNGPSADAAAYEEYCQHCSIMEKRAEQAERTSVKYKQAEFLSDKLGQVFPALISGVSKWGFYAEIEGNKCEGMVPIGSLQGDYYMLDEDNYQIIGRRNGKCYKLGYPVTIRVKGVDMTKKQIDFELVDERAEVDAVLDVESYSQHKSRRSGHNSRHGSHKQGRQGSDPAPAGDKEPSEKKKKHSSRHSHKRKHSSRKPGTEE